MRKQLFEERNTQITITELCSSSQLCIVFFSFSIFKLTGLVLKAANLLFRFTTRQLCFVLFCLAAAENCFN